jgi:small subunit ribosomal protein S21
MSSWKDFDFSKFKGVQIVPRSDEDGDRLVKRFTRKVRNEGILQEVYLRRAYEKPSMKRRRKSARARFLRQLEESE